MTEKDEAKNRREKVTPKLHWWVHLQKRRVQRKKARENRGTEIEMRKK